MIHNSYFSKFLRDQSGQFAIMFAIILLPLLAGVGLAIDYSSALQSSTRLRDSTDAAALFAATEYRQKGALPTNEQVLKFMSQNYDKTSGDNEPTILSFGIVDGKVVLKTEVMKPLAIMGVFGNSDTNIGASSKINISNDVNIEIALVLDTTASMAALSGSSSTDLEPPASGPNPPAPYFPSLIPNLTRIDALKFSAKRFTDTVFANDAGLGQTRVAVVPFSKYVNVGTDKRGASWLTVPDDQAATGQTCSDYTPVISSTNCRQEFYTNDGAQIPYIQCDNVYGPVQNICYPTGGSAWYGCVGSRNHPLNLRDSTPNNKFTGIMDVWCAQPIQPLTDDKTAALSSINNLGTYENTYIPDGVMWGMRVLSTTVPYTEVRTPSAAKKVKKIMVLMTDGDNQAVADLPTAPTHRGIWETDPDYATTRAQTDNWTLEACSEAKSAEIEVYTISFGTDISAQARSVVKSCASDAAHYFDAKDAASLNAAFGAIAAKVGKVFISG
jgi:Flp pilus assembly protein TadG